jgi:hypothetical protein
MEEIREQPVHWLPSELWCEIADWSDGETVWALSCTGVLHK